jgi:hypothetical protein
MFIVRQVEFALFDLLLHLGTMGSDPMEVIEAVRDEVAVVRRRRGIAFRTPSPISSQAATPRAITAISGPRYSPPTGSSVLPRRGRSTAP